ncbi:MAG: PspC domain-containing protein [FCB group bacterium]|nr:PspC domain-containing protein [FCB group bacterium]
MSKRLYRSRSDCTIGGICGGLGEYFAIDPTFIRIIAVMLIFADGVGLIAYLIAWIIIPQRPQEVIDGKVVGEEETATAEGTKEETKPVYGSWNRYIPGAILICIGVYFMVREHFWWWHLERFWPLLLIAVGIYLILKFSSRKGKEGANESGQV